MTDPTLCRRELREDRVLHVRLDRPEARNAFNDQLIAELRATFDEASADDSCRAVLLTGNGKSFSAGADIDWMRQQGELSYIENLASAEEMAGMFQAIYGCRKPVVVAAHGAALGGGTGLVAAADIALCEHSTVLGFTEVRLGILPAVISPYVVEKIGIARARTLFVLGSRFDGREAERIGLVYRSVPDGGLEGAYEELLGELAQAGPSAACEAKALAQLLSPRPPHADLRPTAERIAKIRGSDEAREGLSAFLEKRKPYWCP